MLCLLNILTILYLIKVTFEVIVVLFSTEFSRRFCFTDFNFVFFQQFVIKIFVKIFLADSGVFRQRVRAEGVRADDGQAVHIRADEHGGKEADPQQLHPQQGRQNHIHFQGRFEFAGDYNA